MEDLKITRERLITIEKNGSKIEFTQDEACRLHDMIETVYPLPKRDDFLTDLTRANELAQKLIEAYTKLDVLNNDLTQLIH